MTGGLRPASGVFARAGVGGGGGRDGCGVAGGGGTAEPLRGGAGGGGGGRRDGDSPCPGGKLDALFGGTEGTLEARSGGGTDGDGGSWLFERSTSPAISAAALKSSTARSSRFASEAVSAARRNHFKDSDASPRENNAVAVESAQLTSSSSSAVGSGIGGRPAMGRIVSEEALVAQPPRSRGQASVDGRVGLRQADAERTQREIHVRRRAADLLGAVIVVGAEAVA